MSIALTVAIASHDAIGVIGTCLNALERQRAGCSMQVIVADSSRDGTPQLIRTRFPWVQLLHFDEALSVPELRGRAIACAAAPIIAVLDPYSVPADDWAARVLAAHAGRPHPVIGGAVDLHEPAGKAFGAWVLYFNEYGLFMPPVTEGESALVPGNNVSYKRAALFAGGSPKYPVFWKTFVNEDAATAGLPLWVDPSIVVALNKPIRLADYLRTRYHHGRCYAARRASGRVPVYRVSRAATTPLVPLVLLWRWSRGILAKGRHRPRYLSTLPVQLVLFTCWAWGELWGYLLGDGRSCGRLYY